MKVRKHTGPQRCTLCLKDKDQAIRDHLRTGEPCCAGCPLGNIIQTALRERRPQRNPPVNPPAPHHPVTPPRRTVTYPPTRRPAMVRVVHKKTWPRTLGNILLGVSSWGIWIIVAYLVYYLGYEVYDLSFGLAVVAGCLWPVTLIVCLFYWLLSLIFHF